MWAGCGERLQWLSWGSRNWDCTKVIFAKWNANQLKLLFWSNCSVPGSCAVSKWVPGWKGWGWWAGWWGKGRCRHSGNCIGGGVRHPGRSSLHRVMDTVCRCETSSYREQDPPPSPGPPWLGWCGGQAGRPAGSVCTANSRKPEICSQISNLKFVVINFPCLPTTTTHVLAEFPVTTTATITTHGSQWMTATSTKSTHGCQGKTTTTTTHHCKVRTTTTTTAKNNFYNNLSTTTNTHGCKWLTKTQTTTTEHSTQHCVSACMGHMSEQHWLEYLL